MSDLLFHHTSRAAAQDIFISGSLRPPYPGAKVYFTPDPFERGAEAAARLAITGKIIELACIVPRARISRLSRARHVGSILDANGAEIRPGGGTELWTDSEVDIRGYTWLPLAPP